MSHNNVRFNVSGDSVEYLEATLGLACKMLFGNCIKFSNIPKFEGYKIDPYLGLILYQRKTNYNGKPLEGVQSFPFNEGENFKKLSRFIYNYLDEAEVKTPDFKKYDYEKLQHDIEWDANADHDGHNSKGWRVFVGDWGHIPGHDTSYAILAIRPIFCWYGK